MKARTLIKDSLLIIFGSFLAACSVFFFLLPSGLSVGSIAGVSIILETFLPLSVSTISLILNIILIILGVLLVGREFGGKTIAATLLYSVFLSLLENLLPPLESITGQAFVDLICYIFVLGFSQAVLFGCGSSTGGLDIIAKILNKFTHVELGKAISSCGLIAAACSVFAFTPDVVVLSLLGTYLNGIVVDHFIFGLNPRKRVCILSEKEAEITSFILNDLHSGASIYEAIGAYTGQVQREIVTIVDKNEYRQLMDFLHSTDPAAFVTIYPVNEVLYRKKNV